MYLPVATKVRSYCWPGVAGHLATVEGESVFPLCLMPWAMPHSISGPSGPP